MAKIKKTRKDKKLADQRRKIALTSAQQLAPVKEKVAVSAIPTTVEQNKAPQVAVPTTTISTSGYQYLSRDLLKTTILTSSIVIIELVIKQFARI